MEQNQLKSKMSWSDFKLNSDGMVPVIVQENRDLPVSLQHLGTRMPARH